MAVFAHAQYKIRYVTLIYGGMSEILTLYSKSGSRNMMVLSLIHISEPTRPY